MQSPDNQSINFDKARRLLEIRKTLDLSQEEMGSRLLTGQSAIGKYENGKRPIGTNVEYKILNEFNINVKWWNTGEGDIFNEPAHNNTTQIGGNDSITFEELPFFSTKSSVNFMESLNVTGQFEKYRVLRSNPQESYAGQIVLEVEGDSMEPYYCDGCKLRCKEVSRDDWDLLPSGIYAIVFGNFLVIRRVKNSPISGVLVLHSDNTITSGITEIPLSKIRKIWRALSVVEAPIR